MAIRPFADRSSSRHAAPISGECTGRNVAVPVVGASEADAVDQTRLAMAVAATSGGRVHLFDPTTDRAPTSVGVSDASIEDTIAEARTFDRTRRASGPGMLSGRHTNRDIVRYVREHDVDTLVLPGDLGRGGLGRRRHARLAAGAPCDVISINGDGRYRDFASILLPTAGGPHAGLAIDVAARVAERLDAWIDVLHVLPEDPSDETVETAEERLTTAVERIGRPETVNPWFLRSSNPSETIVEQSTYYGLTVIGAPTSSRLRRFFYGSTSREIRREAESVVIAARTPGDG